METTATKIDINPIHELTKAIGIVHGPAAEQRVRYFLARIEDERQRELNAVPWTIDRIRHMLNTEVQYKDWKFVVQERVVILKYEELPSSATDCLDTDLRLRVEWMGIDTVTGKLEKQQSRWWPLSKHMVKTEIIQTAFLCVLKAEEHEIRETFLYKGKAPFHTHIEIDTLAGVSENVDVRSDLRPEAPGNQRRD